MFRALVVPPDRLPPWAALIGLGLSLIALGALAVAGVADRRLGAIFVAVAAVAAVLLVGLAYLFLGGIRLIGQRGGARMRLALANLHRPGAGAPGVIVALGAGLTVLTMVALLERNLAAELELRLPGRTPAVFFIDIQRDQADAFAEVVSAFEDAQVVQLAPVMRGRVVRIKGVPVDQTGIEHWTLRRDRGLSYAARVPAGSEIVAGAWWPEDYAGPPLVSIEDDVAEAYGVGIGDNLGFNVLGRVIEAEIASLRAEIDWSQGRIDFVFLFSPGVLEAAPHTLAAAVDVPAAGEPVLLDRMAEALPNVTPITIREVVARVGEVLAKIRLAVGVVGGVTLLSGILVLAGAVAAARRRHLYEFGGAQGAGRAARGSAAYLPDRVSRSRRHGGARGRRSRHARRRRDRGLGHASAVDLRARGRAAGPDRRAGDHLGRRLLRDLAPARSAGRRPSCARPERFTSVRERGTRAAERLQLRPWSSSP